MHNSFRKYNRHKNVYIELNNGEQYCPRCLGLGKIFSKHKNSPVKKIIELVCYKCLGEGKLDWVENVVGKSIEMKGND